jgi:methylmalonyl-CoA mutase C-terminal domain/subunit
MTDVAVLVGGIIPEADIPGLKEAGIAGIFLPGSSTQEIVEFVRSHARAGN